MLEEIIHKRIEEEAFFHYKSKENTDALQNWGEAQQEITDRIRFIAFYLHLKDIDRSPMENWLEAEKIYIENF